ncbi:MAG: autotransporter domain-containing protein [Rhizobiales bacterium]|nr:autotransporter domain-containing protein [Hyphomicrobiales bacterium]
MRSENSGSETRMLASTVSLPSLGQRFHARLFASTALAGGVLVALLLVPIDANAQAVNSTWSGTPADNVYRNAANWTNGQVPNTSGVATFGASNTRSLSVTTNFEVGGFTFSAGAPAYTFNFNVNLGHGFFGAGIVNGANQTFVVNSSQLQFINTSSADASSFTVNAGLRFSQNSTAGASIITTNGGGFGGAGTGFDGNSNGGTSTHIIGTNGLLYIDNYGGTGVTIGSLEGAGTVAIGRKTLTIGSNNKSTTYSGVIQNLGRFATATQAGNLAKTGTGTLTLTGTNAYTGTTTVNGGALLVNGSIGTSSGVTVNNGGTIGGTGTLPVTTINSGGTLSPGNSIGTLTITGALTLNAGSTTLIEVQGSTIDRINVTGAATLAGTVRFAALGGSYTFNTPYTFLRAGSITGTFGTKAEQGSFGDGVTTAVSYTSTEARLTLTPSQLTTVVTTQQPFASSQQASSNQFNVASALDRAVAAGANVDAFFNLYNQNRAGILAGLDQLSGAAHANASAIPQQASNSFLGAIFNPVAAGRTAPSGGVVRSFLPVADAASSDPAQQAISRAFGFESVSLSSFRPAPQYNVWASMLGGAGRVDGEAKFGSPRQTSGFGGLSAGVDLRVAPETIVGLAVSGVIGSTSSSQGLGTVKSSQLQLGLYGSTKLGALSLAAGGTWLTGRAEGSRSIPVLGLSKVTSEYDLQGFSGRFEASWALADISGITASPFAAVQGSSIRNSAFTERNEATGAAAGLAVSAKTNVTARTELGLKLETIGRIGNLPATFFVRAGWGHYNQRDANVTGQLVGLSGSQFTVIGTRPDRNVALLTASGEVSLTSMISVGTRADVEVGSRSRSISGTGNIKWAF